MNIFEELVEELKEENLLEETVIETSQEKNKTEFSAPKSESVENVLNEFEDVFEKENSFQTEKPQLEPAETFAAMENIQAEDFGADAASAAAENEKQIAQETLIPQLPIPEAPPSEAEFYSKRATDEVAGLQIVEHIFAGVEREQMKIVPKPFDDLECKKALHAFLQVSENPNTPEHAKAEFQLMQETESWYSALTRRDRNISVTHLRRYCETTRPVLSPTALVSLARFYRNSPFSEQVRSKYDLVLTRLFAKEIINEKRELPFKREDLIKHINTLYSQWASIPLYAASEDDSEILLITLKFEEFMTEAESAESFDELIKTDFFNRLRNFKESTHENFFAPLVTATAIECNVRVGNRYIDLIQAAKENINKEILEDKYGFLHDQAISESSSKTLQLIQLLNKEFEIPEPETEELPETIVVSAPAQTVKKPKIEQKTSAYKVNKWLLAATILIVIVNIALYYWMGSEAEIQKTQATVERVNLENSVLRDFIKEARISEGTFFGVVQSNWSELSLEKQEEVLKLTLSTGNGKGFTKVHLLDKNGRTVGFADENGIKTQ